MTTEGSTPFGERLKRLREQAGLTQEQLAEKAAISVQGVASIESGRSKRPYPHTVRALTDALGLSAQGRDELLGAMPRQRDRSVPSPTTSPAPPTEIPEVRLPAPLTGLVGRERELRELGTLFRDGARLVTLTGPGGVGKTRLGIELARELSGVYQGGVVFVPLAPLADAALVLPAIAHALRLQEAGGQPIADLLRAHLQDRHLLLVLDNFEQVLDASPDVADLLVSSEGTAVLATSRAPLRVRGEREYQVRPLEVPDLARVPEVRDVAGNAAVELFVERAATVVADFSLTRSNAASVAAICRRLDGLPLAIELAAARIRAIGPTELLARLDSALPLLTGGARDLPERQRTMEAAIGWSHELLAPPEQEMFRRLSVFAGGWNLEAAEAVGSGGLVGQGEVLDLTSRLAEQSLVIVGTGEEVRYRMLEPLRQYALQRLRDSGEEGEVRSRHADYFRGLAGRAEPELTGARQAEWLHRLDAEHGNLRAALERLLGSGDLEAAAAMGWDLWVYWWIRGYQSEGRGWMERILGVGENLSPVGRARALSLCGSMALGQGDLGYAEERCGESYPLFQEVGDEAGAARARLIQGLVASARADIRGAEACLGEAAQAFREARAHFWASLTLSALGMLPFREGDYDRAEEVLEEGTELARRAGDRFSRYIALYNRSQLAQTRGDYDRAADLFEEGLVFSQEVGDRANVAQCLEGLAAVELARDRPGRAARLLGAAHALFESVGARVYTYRPNRSLQERTVAAAKARLGEPAWTMGWDQGRAMTVEGAFAFALGSEDADAAERLADPPSSSG